MGFKSSPSDITGPVKWRGIPSGTLGGAGSYLGIASDNQVVLTTLVHGGGGTVSAVANGSNDRIATFSSADALNGEANLTFDGSTLTVAGDVLPAATNTKDLGSNTKRWAEIHATNIYTGDLNLTNERGSWSIIEEEDYLSVTNNKTGKVYKMVLEEVE